MVEGVVADDKSQKLNDGTPLPIITPFNAFHLFGFLIGLRGSIEKLIASKRALWLGGCLVGTAALAREYDAISLIHHPLDMLGPFAASVVLSLVLYFVVQLLAATTKSPEAKSSVNSYLVFLTGYWMTAPLAWLYAVPIETMTTETSAVKFNLTMLSIVSLWRVILFSRFISIRYRLPFSVSLLWIMLPCMVIAFFAVVASVLSTIEIMGGLRISETERIMNEYRSYVASGLLYAFIPVSIMTIFATKWTCNQLENAKAVDYPVAQSTPIHWSAWLIPIVVFAILLFGCSYFQPSLRNAADVDAHLDLGEYDAAIAKMEELGVEAFPATWDPPPQVKKGQYYSPDLPELMRAIQIHKPSHWISDRLLHRAEVLIGKQANWFYTATELEDSEAFDDRLVGNLQYYDAAKLEELRLDYELLASMPASTPKQQALRDRWLRIVQRGIEIAKEPRQENDAP